MTKGTLIFTAIGGLLGLPFVVLAQDGFSLLDDTGVTWDWNLTTGYDATLHTCALASGDTTETISEFLVQAGLQGQSARATPPFMSQRPV